MNRTVCIHFFMLLICLSEICFSQSINLTPSDDLRSAIYSAEAGTVILLEDGVYRVDNIIQIRNEEITLAGKSGNRDAVILDGNNGSTALDRDNFTSEILQITASDVTVSDLTIRYASCHAVHASGASGSTIKNLTLRNLHIYDCGEQLVKVNSNGNQENLTWVDSGIVENCLIEFVDNSVMHDMETYFYTGGIDVHGGRDWVIRNNTFANIWRDDKPMEHAIHFWSRSRNTLIENNTFVNCWRAVGLGMKTSESGLTRNYEDQAGEDPYFDHVGGMVRNNVVFNDESHALETGIELMNVINAEVYHNTIISVAEPFNCIEYRWPNTFVYVKNNLCSNRIMGRDGAQAQSETNITDAPLSCFVNTQQLDFHLSSGASDAIDKGVVLENQKAGVDMDGQRHGSSPDIGADEWESAIARANIQNRSRVGWSNQANVMYTLSGIKINRPVCIADMLIIRKITAGNVCRVLQMSR